MAHYRIAYYLFQSDKLCETKAAAKFSLTVMDRGKKWDALVPIIIFCSNLLLLLLLKRDGGGDCSDFHDSRRHKK